jgi:hypothetical protein
MAFKPLQDFLILFLAHNPKTYLKNVDQGSGQEAHLNQYNQMCYPAHAGARVGEKVEHTR